MGYSYAEAGINLDEAERLIREALEAKPNSGHIIDSLGWVYFKKGLYDKALVEIKRAFRKLPTDSTVAEHLGDVYLKQNRYQDALRIYKKAIYLEDADIRRLKHKIEDIELHIKRMRQQVL